VRREKQLLVDYFCRLRRGLLYYTGRDMKLSHEGMGIDESDWKSLIGHLEATLDAFRVPTEERSQVLAFIGGTKGDIVE
jgi:hemoglobin